MSRMTGGSSRTPPLPVSWSGAIEGHVVGLAWSPDGSRLAAASVEGPITLFASSGEVLHHLPGHGFGTTDLSWGADGSILASAGQDGMARAWDPQTGAERFSVKAGAAWVEHVAWSPVGSILATSAGKKLRLWDETGAPVLAYPDQPATIAAIAWKPRANEIASAAYGHIAVWSPDSDVPRVSFPWKGSMLALAWSPDGRHIATGDQDASVHFWEIATGRDLMMWGYQTKVRALSWDASGRYLATSGSTMATVWDCSGKGPEGTEPIALGNSQGAILSALAFRPSGPTLATSDVEGRIRLWRVTGKDGERLASANLDTEVTALSWHPSGRSLAASTAAGGIAVFAWNAP